MGPIKFMTKRDLHLNPPPKTILIISMRYLGDLLLTTPLIRTLKKAYPNVEVDVLTYGNTIGMLEGNTDIRTVISSPIRPKFGDYKRIIKTLFRSYDLVVSTQTGDRQFVYSLLASARRVSFVPPRSEKGWWKRYFFQGWEEFNNLDNHTVLEFLKLPALLGLTPQYELIPPITQSLGLLEGLNIIGDYAVLHVHPQWTYKQWHKQGWIDVAHYLTQSGLKIILSGGSDKKEQDYITDIQQVLPKDTLNLAGKVSLAELNEIISQAKLFIGPDTGITHLAAASNIPVLTLFGPTNPIKWGPWPKHYRRSINPYTLKGNQQVNNIYLIQGSGDCVPCDLEGCDRHRLSRSMCLDTLSSMTVIKYIDQAFETIK